ncbi:glutamate--cysteine ligase [Corynebacterium sp. TAE3-ERU12]|uniref:glutamate--cysteine ligase n=1 Tax=Corynebacterium sp. TAE3-ERU12 TaxID=2849491 RepID=UPI001C46CBAD|nr:glutamate--cysteine ligase [Corynebacterium sp. TAE3-ERU12]MBV7295961.1 glutamate--cysteine ligase [Corynebacterium sp. TAE3-ERU12]
MTENFVGSPKPTLGCEWELAFVDRTTRDTVPCADDVLATIAEDNPEHGIHREFLANTVELVTDVCTDVPEIVADLQSRLELVQAACDKHKVDLWTSGSHPFARGTDQRVNDKSTYQEILDRTQWWGRQMVIWGVHVHVGVRSADRVWPIINALQVQLPHMLALSGSSPAWNGEDMGYASNRTLLFQQLPTADLPPDLHTWAEYEQYMADQAKSGVINHTGSMHLDIRPAEKFGTIEVRVADSTSNIQELSALVALTHSLVVHYDRMLDRGEQLPSLPPWHNRENKWRAARYGMDALIITDRDTTERWVTEDLHDLLDTLRPVAKDLNCASELEQVTTIMELGAGYQRQRRVAHAAGALPALAPEQKVRDVENQRGGSPWAAAVDLVVRELAAGHPLKD